MSTQFKLRQNGASLDSNNEILRQFNDNTLISEEHKTIIRKFYSNNKIISNYDFLSANNRYMSIIVKLIENKMNINLTQNEFSFILNHKNINLDKFIVLLQLFRSISIIMTNEKFILLNLDFFFKNADNDDLSILLNHSLSNNSLSDIKENFEFIIKNKHFFDENYDIGIMYIIFLRKYDYVFNELLNIFKTDLSNDRNTDNFETDSRLFETFFNILTDLEMLRSADVTIYNDMTLFIKFFKIIYSKFKNKYLNDERLLKINKKIIDFQKIKQTVDLFNNDFTQDFDGSIIDYTDEYINSILTNMVFLESNNNNTSFKFKGKYKGQLCQLIINLSLSDENKIYRYLKNELIKPIYTDYCITVLDVFKTVGQNISFIKEYIKEYTTLYFIITENIEGTTLEEFVNSGNDNHNQNKNDDNLMIQILFDILYAIYLMNNKLHIIHNSKNVINNIIITKLNTPIEQVYYIDNIKMCRMRYYRIYLCDFKNSYLNIAYEENNYTYGSIDFDILVIILFLYELNPLSIFLTDLITKVLLNNNNIRLFNDIFKKKLNKFCRVENNNKCQKISVITLGNLFKLCDEKNKEHCTKQTDITVVKILQRFISDEKYYNILQFTNSSALFKKYLKYKNKYLSIKNNI